MKPAVRGKHLNLDLILGAVSIFYLVTFCLCSKFFFIMKYRTSRYSDHNHFCMRDVNYGFKLLHLEAGLKPGKQLHH